MNYWLIKSDPETYDFQQMKKDKTTDWTGVRNYQARNNMKIMRKGDLCLFYHSNDDRAVLGVVEVVKEAYTDPEDKNFVLVDVKYKSKFVTPVTLKDIKKKPGLKNIALIKQSRLSVMPVSKSEWSIINEMAA